MNTERQAERDIKGVASEYWRLGLNIVPVKGKTPLIKWAELQSSQQSSDDFINLPWNQADGFALIGGAKRIDGLYLGAIDYDVKNVSENAKELGKKFLKDLLATRIEKTPSGGEHWVFYSRKQPGTVSSFHDSLALELLGKDKLIVMAPSNGYTRMNDNEPTVLEDLESTFYDGLYHIGVGKSREATKTAAPRKRRRKTKARMCCEVALEKDRRISHLMRLAIASEYKRLGLSEVDVVELFGHQADFDRDKCLTQVASANPARTASCVSIKSWGYCLPECPKTPGVGGGTKGDEEGRESQADAMIKLAQAESVSLFHDERREPYIRIRKGEALVTMRLRSKETKTWLSSLLWRDREKAPSGEALSSALNVLEALANDGEKHQLYNRVAPGEDGSIWLDLCDDQWRAIHVTRAGWEVVNHPPILFRRYSHQQPIPIPIHGSLKHIGSILDYANIKHLGDQLLYVVAVITNLIPGIPHVVIILFGPQGSGKTWALRIIRLLIDPSQLDLLSLPTRYVELVQNLDHSWCSFFDNIGSLPPWQSNVFCRAVTGGGVSKRQLYTDDDDIIYQYHRCVGLTDINIAAERGDLLQRSVLLGLEAIPKDHRKTESELRARFAQDQPKILAGMLDVLVKALNLYPTVKLESLNRMADYTIWGHAITQALGLKPECFINAYEENINAQNLEAVRANPISDALISLMETNKLTGWSGTVSQLFSELEEKAKDLKISTRQKAWPKKPHVLSRILNELAPSLSAVGLEIERDRTGSARLIHINAVPGVTSVARQSDWGKGSDLKAYLSDASDASAGSFESLSGNQVEMPTQPKNKEPEKLAQTPSQASQASSVREFFAWLQSEFQKGNNPILSLVPLDPVQKGTCPLCQKHDVNLVWQLQFVDGSRYDGLCVDCGGRIQDLVREFEERSNA